MTAGKQAGWRPGQAEREQDDAALRILGERLARGEIGIEDYHRRRAVLGTGPPAPPRARRRRGWLVILLAAVVVAAAGLAAAAVAGPGPWYAPWASSRTTCTTPSLPGTVVNVTATDMGGMGGMMGGGMMRVSATPASIPAGTVSLRVANTGTLTHELVILPLPAGQPPGSRVAGPDRTVSETGSLGEASATCAAGHGDGITPGAVSWVTLNLRPGRYELICNLPGHYANGMYTELDVT